MSGRKVTLREYIDKCRQFNPQFDYSDLGFITISGQFVTPICKKHGKFKFNARGLCTKSIRCPECDRENRFNSFIQKAKEIHGEKYKYDQSTYITNKIPIKITCLIHGDFYQAPGDHLKDAQNVLENTNLQQKNGYRKQCLYSYKYDYSKVEYKDNKTPVIIICPIHGEFKVIPNNHIAGKSGCPKCKGIDIHNRQVKSMEQFIQQAIEKHGNRYNYEKLDIITIKVM